MSNWVTTKKLTKLYTFKFNRDNNYTAPIPKDIKNFDINNLVVSIGNIQSYLNILGYSLKPYRVDNSIQIEVTMDILEKAGEQIDTPSPDEDGLIMYVTIGGAVYRLYDRVKFVQIFLSSNNFGKDDSTFTEVYINGVFYKKFLNIPNSYAPTFGSSLKVKLFNTLMDIDFTEIKNTQSINEIELKFFTVDGSRVHNLIHWGYLFGDCIIVSAYVITRDTKNTNLDFDIYGYYLEEI